MKGKKITILGAGISGLASAHWLEKAGYDVTILEQNSEPGGAMKTKFIDGFLVDFGPNSGLETT
ncbi:MAG: FAD-dependent oxidoreductase, partial [Ignavibacteriae bacterium]|nr:FAD-dependent oxidoreductase [Ignavibacteriota bacterium]